MEVLILHEIKKWKCIDLCAGIGGIRRGFELTGRFENVLSAEIDKYAIRTYAHLFNEKEEEICNDVMSEEFKEKVSAVDYDVLLAGFPCQAFSRAGKEEGFLDSTRGTIFFHIADIIKRSNPKMFLLENVDNLLSHDKGKTFNTILETLIYELGYSIVGVSEKNDGTFEWERSSFLRNTKNFGIPQNRPRVFMMGFSNKYFGKEVLQKVISELPKERNDLELYRDLEDLLEFNAEKRYYVASGYLETLEKHKQRHKGKGNGFGYIVLNDDDMPKPYISNAILATGGSGKERNMVKDSLEYAGQDAPNKKTPLNERGIRHMTPTEWGKLQGFINYGFKENGKESFSFPPAISVAQQYKQFGNSVTIPVIESMAQHMLNILDEVNKIRED